MPLFFRSSPIPSAAGLLLLLLPLCGRAEVRDGAALPASDSGQGVFRSSPDSRATQDSTAFPGLDQAAVHAFYLEGEFDSVQARIHGFRKENPEHSRDDSLFIARHLAVVLAANPNSVEAGKYWMHHLLVLSPHSGLDGMYVSEAIEDIFRRVKKEAKDRAGGTRRRKWLWLGAAGTAVAAGAAAWLILDPEPEGSKRKSVPVTL